MTPADWYDRAALAIARSLRRPCPHPGSYRVPTSALVKRGSTDTWHREIGTACRACGFLVALDQGWTRGTEAWVGRLEWRN